MTPWVVRAGIALLPFSAVAACSNHPTASAPPAEQPFITDDAGGAIILRGVNVMNATKSDPNRLAEIGPDDANRIANDWGMNFVRLLILWDALEPTEGTFSSSYLDGVQARVDLLAKAGIHVMLDMHQDVYAAEFCCDGAPAWAIDDDDAGFTLQSNWGLNYLQPAVVHAFDNFWAADGAHPELQKNYAAAWRAVAARFAGYPGVLGYDLMNEPFPGSDFDAFEAISRLEAPDGGTSHLFDDQKLGPFYQTVIDSIRQVDPDGWIFLEPRYAAPANGSPSYLPKLDDPRAGPPRLASAPHLYSSAASIQNQYTTDDMTVPSWEAARTAEQAAWPAPLLMGEWGTAFSMQGATQYADDILAMADRMRASWAYWSYDPGAAGSWGLFDPTTLADNPAVSIVIRPYPRRVAGYPESWSFDTASGQFDLVFASRAGVTGATDLFIPASIQYPNGWTASLVGEASSAWTSAWSAATSVLSITTDPATAEHNVRVTAGH